MNQKSLIFLLIVLTVAAVVFYLVQSGSEITEPQKWINSHQAPKLESGSVIGFDAELNQEMQSYDKDLSDLNSLNSDASLNKIGTDLTNLGL